MDTLQKLSIPVLRILIGWHLLYEGIVKLLNPGWSAAGFLSESQGVLAGFSEWIVSNNSILMVVNFLNIWGLIIIGLGLVLGLFTRLAAALGTLLLLLYYFTNPPLIGSLSSVLTEGNYLLVNKTLIEGAALFVVAVFTPLDGFRLDCLFKYLKRK